MEHVSNGSDADPVVGTNVLCVQRVFLRVNRTVTFFEKKDLPFIDRGT